MVTFLLTLLSFLQVQCASPDRSPAMAKAKKERDKDLSFEMKERVARAAVRGPFQEVDWLNVDREIERLKKTDPCFGKPQRFKRNAEGISCKKNETLVGQGSLSGECCVVNPLSKDILLQARSSNFENDNGEGVEHLAKVVRVPDVRVPFTDAKLSNRGKDGAIRIAAHNIERGLEFDNLRRYYHSCPEALLLSKNELNPVKDADKIAEICAASQSDILLLNEVDRGICRSRFRSVAEDLALSLNMNYVSGTEFIELGDKLIGNRGGEEDCAKEGFDFSRMRNEHQNAILSRYPLEFVRRVEVENCNNWLKDGGQPRRGGRMGLIAKVTLPVELDSNAEWQEAIVVSVHLENKTSAECRATQLRQVLTAVEAYETETKKSYPVIIGGDFNPTLGSVSPLRDEWEKFGYDARGNRGSTYMLGQRLDYLITRAPKTGSRLGDCFHSVWDLTPSVSKLEKLSDHKPIFIDVPLRCE